MASGRTSTTCTAPRWPPTPGRPPRHRENRARTGRPDRSGHEHRRGEMFAEQLDRQIAFGRADHHPGHDAIARVCGDVRALGPPSPAAATHTGTPNPEAPRMLCARSRQSRRGIGSLLLLPLRRRPRSGNHRSWWPCCFIPFAGSRLLVAGEPRFLFAGLGQDTAALDRELAGLLSITTITRSAGTLAIRDTAAAISVVSWVVSASGWP